MEVQRGSLVLDRVDASLLGPGPSSIQSLLKARDSDVGGRSFTLDTSLERVFGTGATLLAIEFEGMGELRRETQASSEDSSTDSDEEMQVSTPTRDELGKKRDRTGASVSFGNLSEISEVKAHELSSSGEEFEEFGSDIKKPRITPGDASKEDDMVSRILADDENMGGGDTLVELHEKVPHDDPGPSGCGGKSPSGGTQ